MSFCRNCGNKISDEARFCENCGAEAIPVNSSQYVQQPVFQKPQPMNITQGRGEELGRISYNFPTVRAYIGRIITCSIMLVPLIFLILLVYFAAVSDAEDLSVVTGLIIFEVILLVLAVGVLLLIIFAGVSIAQYKKNYICICENCVYGMSARTFSAKPFEIPYEAVINVSYKHTSAFVVNHYVSIKTPNEEIFCSVENPENVAGFIVQTMNRKFGRI